jgi:flagellar basal-body rod protein FlgB
MNYDNITLFNLMKSKMGYMSQRQGVLAQNIANADTPGYQAMDVKAPDFKKILARSSGQLQMATTDGKHFTGTRVSASATRIIHRDSTYERNPNGNNVAIEEEMSKIAENQAEYQKVLNLYRKSVDMFKTAIGKTNG